MSFLSIAQKSVIKARSVAESSSIIALEYGISRQRVRQIANEDPDSWRDYRDLPADHRRWKPKGLTAEQIMEILSSTLGNAHLARRFGVSLYQIERLRHSSGATLRPGRPPRIRR